MVCFEVRFSAQFTLIKSVVDQGLLGELHYGEVDYYHGLGPWYGQFTWNVKKDVRGIEPADGRLPRARRAA